MRTVSMLLVTALTAFSCKDHILGARPEAPTGTGYCAVQSLLQAECISCHSGGAPQGDLDLSGDIHAAVVNVVSAQTNEYLLVAPGDANASLLYLKMAGTQPSSAGNLMPPEGLLDEAHLEVVRDWIDAGASSECDAQQPGDTNPPDTADTAYGEGWCQVLGTLNAQCVGCHSASSAMGGLDLESDPYAALVNASSTVSSDIIRVVPENRDASLLWRKLNNTQSADEGDMMPPAGLLSSTALDNIGTWIDDGASDACDEPPSDTGINEGYHPDGWADADQHGMGAKMGELPCINCHGEDLNGGLAGVSCDECHDKGWRNNCTFCHGGTDNPSGAPPRDIDNQSNTSTLSFQAHSAHVTASDTHDGFECSECHTTPTNVLSLGHVLVGDTTPGQAEVNFTDGLSQAASWNGQTCTNLYCHGYAGQDNGSMDHDDAEAACGSCHPAGASSEDAWEDRMSGEHHEHLRRGASCSDCHGSTVNTNGVIINTQQHVNGTVDISLPTGMSRTGSSCTGECHIDDREEEHRSNNWF